MQARPAILLSPGRLDRLRWQVQALGRPAHRVQAKWAYLDLDLDLDLDR